MKLLGSANGEGHALAGKHSWTNTVMDNRISSAFGKCCNRGHGFHIEKATDTGLLRVRCIWTSAQVLLLTTNVVKVCLCMIFIFYFIRTQLCIAFLEKVKLHYKDCR